ncbi:MAG: hypothetical protein DWQ34_03065 [Planctomycetota bacterium]|nr:MAG: hypothetical protein DWQ34_03065 [Planctomycetota bacterium]REK21496.1 MAG: hypothetical protein DWQ41_21295 [Planctomycetota bacterium]REK34333.1 MAG: hypothetical protein DWQ45_13735 [Planctomycetota bacterium]
MVGLRGLTTFEVLPSGFDYLLIIVLASVTGFAISRVFCSSTISSVLLLSGVSSAVATGTTAALHTLFVPPPPGTLWKWGNDLQAAMFTGGVGAVISIPIALLISGVLIVLVRLIGHNQLKEQ